MKNLKGLSMADSDVVERAKRELLRRKAAAELDRRRAAQPTPTGSEKGILDQVMAVADKFNPPAALGRYLGEKITDVAGDKTLGDVASDVSKDISTTVQNAPMEADATIRGAADVFSLGMADEIAALANRTNLMNKENYSDATNPLEMVSDINPIFNMGRQLLVGTDEKYEKELAKERARDRYDAENRSSSRLAGQIAGGVTQGLGLAKNGLSATTKAIEAGKSLPAIMGYGAAEGGALSALQGLGSGEDIEDRINKALWGGAIGGVLGGGVPALTAGLKKVVDPIAAYINPEAAKDRVMAALLRKSGMTADDIADQLRGAQEDVQPMFMAADVLETPGQRILSTAARTPNEARKAVVDALRGRQMDQGRRVAADLAEASGSNLTAEQYQQMLRQARSAEAAQNYAPVMEDVTAINVSPAVAQANRAISPVADRLAVAREALPTDLAARAPIEAQEASIRDPIRQALKEARSYLASDNLTVTNVEKAFRAKTNIDQMINKATENGQGAMVEALMPIQQQLDDALAATSSQYAAARDAYRTASQNVEAVDVGRNLARGRNRVEDTLSTFGALPSDDAMQAARVGYFDPKIAAAESAKGKLTDVARQFTSESMRRELPELAVPSRAEQLMRRLNRENTMSDTAQIALGGSKTADNLADIADSSIDPGVIAALAGGRFKDAAMSAFTQTANAAKGMPPRVVERLIPALMETNPEVARELFSASAQKMALSDKAKAAIAAALLGSGSSVPARVLP